jgi:hypothetical protein
MPEYEVKAQKNCELTSQSRCWYIQYLKRYLTIILIYLLCIMIQNKIIVQSKNALNSELTVHDKDIDNIMDLIVR